MTNFLKNKGFDYVNFERYDSKETENKADTIMFVEESRVYEIYKDRIYKNPTLPNHTYEGIWCGEDTEEVNE